MRRRTLLFVVATSACGKAGPRSDRPRPGDATTAPPAPTGPPSPASGPAVVLDGVAYDPDTGAVLKRRAAPGWPPPEREAAAEAEREQFRRRATLGRALATALHQEGLIAVAPLDGGDWAAATAKRVARFDAAGTAHWEAKKPRETFVARADFLPLPGGDLLFFDYCAIADGGVELVRFGPSDGRERYRVDARPLGVAHSEYTHAAFVRLRGERVDVVSVGAGGTLVEVFDVATGASLRRWTPA